MKHIKNILLLTLVIFSFSALQAEKVTPFTTKGVLKALKAEVQLVKAKGIVDVKIPSFNKDWKVHVLAEDKMINEKIEVSGKSLVYIGGKMFTEKLIIHGDGILFVNGELVCPEIDIKGNALVIFNDNKVKYYGGHLKIGSGLIIARKGNHLNIHMRQDGCFYAGVYNKGEIVSKGQVSIYINGPQKGDIFLGAGTTRPAKIYIAGMLQGRITSAQNTNVEVKKSIAGDISIKGNLNLKADDFIDSDITVSKTLTANLASISSEKNKRSQFRFALGSLVVKNSSEATMVSGSSFKYMVGKNHLGGVFTKTGLTMTVGNNSIGNIVCGESVQFKATNYLGLFEAKVNATIRVKKRFESYALKVGQNCSMIVSTFKGNADIGKKGTLSANNFLSSSFSHHLKMKTGTIIAKQNNHLLVDIASNGSVTVGENNTKNIKIGKNGKISVGKNCDGRITIGGMGDVRIAQKQSEIVYIAKNGKVNLGVANKSVIVVKSATIKIGVTKDTYYDEGIIRIGDGTIQISAQNEFDIIATNANSKASLRVGSNNNGDVNLAGKGMIQIVKTLTGDVKVSDTAAYRSANQLGKMYFGNTVNCNITGKLEGNLYVAANTGKSMFVINKIIDSNIGIYAWGSIRTTEVLDLKGSKEDIFIKTGELVAKKDIEANFSAKEAILLQAKNIYGNVDVGDESSHVNAIVKGNMKVGL